MYTRESIRELLRNNDRAVLRAISCLYEGQTEDERTMVDVKHSNSRGFSRATRVDGTRLAKMISAGLTLNDQDFCLAYEIARFHAVQLARVANDRSAS